MNARFQFGVCLAALALSVVMAVPFAAAQNHPKDRAAQRDQQHQNSRGASHPSRDNPRPQSTPGNRGYHPQNAPRRGANDARQPAYDSRVYRDNRPQNQARQSPAPQPNPQDRLRTLSPQDRKQLAQREEQFRRLSPQQQADMRKAQGNWEKMTPEQRDHIRNEILPKWKELPSDRQRAIQQRLGVLRNMPESARNRHLSDPNFTRGMSDDDRQLLRDLSHEHVGAPDQHDQRPPQEQ